MIILGSSFCHSQQLKISKRSVLSVFERTIVQEKRGVIQTDSNSWYTDNTSNKYFENDTIIFRNAKTFKRNFCKTVNWNFYENNKFVAGYSNYCDEPPTKAVTQDKDWIELKIVYRNDAVLLNLYNRNKIVEKFKIVALEKIKSVYDENEDDLVLVLVRINK